MSLFRPLTSDEESEFRQWARENYECGKQISSAWHPVIQMECARMNYEYYDCDVFTAEKNMPEQDEANTDEENTIFDILYNCPFCHHEWRETWTCACDSDCPKCGTRNIEAKSWKEIKKEEINHG